MPPVFGPSSPSSARLKSCAAPSGTAFRPSHSANSDTSRPSSSSSTTTVPPNAAAARTPASTSSSVRQTKTPFPAASPSAFTTHGGRATASVAAVGTPAASSTSFANAFEPSIRAAAALGPKTAIARVPEPVGDAGDERRLRPDHDEVGGEHARQVEQALAVVGPHGMAVGRARRCRDCRAPRAAR